MNRAGCEILCPLMRVLPRSKFLIKPMKKPRPFLSMHHRGFTLTEALVAIVILISLAILALSGLSKLRAVGDKAVAARNLSQLQLANASHAADHGGKFVPVYSFDEDGVKTSQWTSNPDFLVHFKADGLHDSKGKVAASLPINLMDPVTSRAKKKGFDDIASSYGYNTEGLPGYKLPGASAAYTLSQLASPNRTVAFSTATDWIVCHGSRFRWTGTAAVEGRSTDQKMAFRHKGKALVAYYDGHVGEVSFDDLRTIDKQGGKTHPFWLGTAK
jgi:prepilin-type processing-associated H-X9-DG protein